MPRLSCVVALRARRRRRDRPRRGSRRAPRRRHRRRAPERDRARRRRAGHHLARRQRARARRRAAARRTATSTSRCSRRRARAAAGERQRRCSRTSPARRPRPSPSTRALGGSEFTREDLQPFDAGRYGSPTIVDRSPAETTVSLDPHGSQYSLVVITFDREKQVPVKVMSYKDTSATCSRMRREQRPRAGRRPLAADRDLDARTSRSR